MHNDGSGHPWTKKTRKGKGIEVPSSRILRAANLRVTQKMNAHEYAYYGWNITEGL